MKDNNRKETIKTIALTALLAGVISFVAGVHYQQDNAAQIQAAARALVPVVHATSK